MRNFFLMAILLGTTSFSTHAANLKCAVNKNVALTSFDTLATFEVPNEGQGTSPEVTVKIGDREFVAQCGESPFVTPFACSIFDKKYPSYYIAHSSSMNGDLELNYLLENEKAATYLEVRCGKAVIP